MTRTGPRRTPAAHPFELAIPERHGLPDRGYAGVPGVSHHRDAQGRLRAAEAPVARIRAIAATKVRGDASNPPGAAIVTAIALHGRRIPRDSRDVAWPARRAGVTIRDGGRGMTTRAESGFARVAASFAVFLLLASAGGGCRREGSGDGKDSRAPAAAGAKTELILAAYTTPREAYGKAIIPAFREVLEGEDRPGRGVPGVLPGQRRAGAGDHRRLRGRHRRALARSRHRQDRRGGADHARLEGQAARRDGQHLGRGPRRPPGQPEGHPRLGRPGAPGRRSAHARPEDLRRRAVEHQRDLRRGAARHAGRARRATRRPRESSSSGLQQRLDHGQGRARVDHERSRRASATRRSPTRTRCWSAGRRGRATTTSSRARRS